MDTSCLFPSRLCRAEVENPHRVLTLETGIWCFSLIISIFSYFIFLSSHLQPHQDLCLPEPGKFALDTKARGLRSRGAVVVFAVTSLATKPH